MALGRSHVPHLVLVQKRDVWWMRALGHLLRPINPDFMTRYTTVIGATVYLPRPLAEIPREQLAQILAHELVHQLDMYGYGLGFYLSYLLTPLPVWRTHRAYWERRAYAVDLILAHLEGGDGRLALEETRLRGIFGGPAYGWMWGGRVAAASYLRPIAAQIRAGKLQQQWPYSEILEAWGESDGDESA